LPYIITESTDERGDKMKTVLLIGMVLLLLALDWATLHDILKGEPNLYAEYGMILFSAMIFGAMIFIGMRGRDRRAAL
jgi:hypothetical protein